MADGGGALANSCQRLRKTLDTITPRKQDVRAPRGACHRKVVASHSNHICRDGALFRCREQIRHHVQ
jgi:hypothetical protein